MVGGAGNAPVVTSDSYFRHRFYRPAAGTPPKLVAGVGVAPTEAELMRLAWISFSPQWNGGVDGYRPHMSLLAGQVHYLSATTPLWIGKPPWCCPRQAEFWRLCCTSWCAAYLNGDFRLQNAEWPLVCESEIYKSEQSASPFK